MIYKGDKGSLGGGPFTLVIIMFFPDFIFSELVFVIFLENVNHSGASQCPQNLQIKVNCIFRAVTFQ